MAAEKGRNMLLQVSDGGGPAVFTSVAGLKSNTFTINNELFDITTKDSNAFRELLADTGTRSFTMGGAGIFKDTVDEKQMLTQAMEGTILEFRMIFETGDFFQGFFQVASLEYTGEFNGAREYSITLENDGVVTFTEAV